MDYLGIPARVLLAFALFLSAALIARSLTRFIPEGEAKRWLTKPQRIQPDTEEELKDWTPFWALVVATVALFSWFSWLLSLGSGE